MRRRDEESRLRDVLSGERRICPLRESLENAGIGHADEIVNECETRLNGRRLRDECVIYVVAYTHRSDGNGFIYQRVNDCLREGNMKNWTI